MECENENWCIEMSGCVSGSLMFAPNSSQDWSWMQQQLQAQLYNTAWIPLNDRQVPGNLTWDGRSGTVDLSSLPGGLQSSFDNSSRNCGLFEVVEQQLSSQQSSQPSSQPSQQVSPQPSSQQSSQQSSQKNQWQSQKSPSQTSQKRPSKTSKLLSSKQSPNQLPKSSSFQSSQTWQGQSSHPTSSQFPELYTTLFPQSTTQPSTETSQAWVSLQECDSSLSGASVSLGVFCELP
ncbi:uncharacterized protein [Cherax quadricarinatus]|uniref:uncharacterized protein n=1 Tax=Cherax quadricarinatus TaxID=27406 RepID=UPI00387E471C